MVVAFYGRAKPHVATLKRSYTLEMPRRGLVPPKMSEQTKKVNRYKICA